MKIKLLTIASDTQQTTKNFCTTNSTPHTKHTPIVLTLVHTLHIIVKNSILKQHMKNKILNYCQWYPTKHQKLLYTNSTPHTKYTTPIVLPLVHTLHLIASTHTHTHTPYTLHPYSIRPLYPHHITLHIQHPFQFRPSTARTHTHYNLTLHITAQIHACLIGRNGTLTKTNNIYKLVAIIFKMKKKTSQYCLEIAVQ